MYERRNLEKIQRRKCMRDGKQKKIQRRKYIRDRIQKKYRGENV